MSGIKVHDFGDSGDSHVYCIHCPGCRHAHCFEVPRWSWNGSYTAPTFTPSMLCNKDYPESRCHSFVTDGRIQFLTDCWHPLAGQTVDIPDWDSEEFS